MRLTPESKSVLDTLLAGGTVKSEKCSVGPLDETTCLLLQLLIDSYDALSMSHGPTQVESLLKTYLDTTKRKKGEVKSGTMPSKAQKQDPTKQSQKGTLPPAWKLHEVKCRSIRGVAPQGEEFPFSFDGKSTLLFGPNGSGKTSLLNAVMWVLTGLTFTDEIEPTEITSIHTTSQDMKRGSKICDWPTISTLPETNNLSSVTPDSMATIQLKSCDSKTTIYLRRTLDKGLEVNDDGQNWTPCSDLAKYGIQPLDLQLSIVAPTVFGRQVIEKAPDSRKILSLMLGYDPLEDIGDLISTLARNRTLLFNHLTKIQDDEHAILLTKIVSLPNLLPAKSELKKPLEELRLPTKLSPEKIKEISQKITDQIAHSVASLAQILGVANNNSPVSMDLAENLVKAVGRLEKGFPEIWPSFSSIELKSVLLDKDGVPSQEQLSKLQKNLESFTTAITTDIAERLQWWRKETAPASKAKLLLLAAKNYYDTSKMKCPICERSVEGLPVKDELESLRRLDQKLLEDLKLFFANLKEGLDNIIPQNVMSISNALPVDRLLADWKALKDGEEFAEFSPILDGFQDTFTQLVSTVETISPPLPQLLPTDSEPVFFQAASSFISKVNYAYISLEILQWASTKFDLLKQKLCNLITASLAENPFSLLALLSKGKSAAQEIEPLKMLQTQLVDIKTDYDNILEIQVKIDTLENLKSPLENLKNLSKYAIDKTSTIFIEIKDKAIKNWRLLYPEDPAGIYPSRLVMTGRDKLIESLLAQANYEVPGPPFANAGLQRAIALSFLCALFEKHPRGLGFVIFDDPILSLDEDHRERWSGKILVSHMQNTQIILATHQRQFLTNCKHDFASGKVIELNPRDRKRKISWMPGDILNQAEDLLVPNWKYVPNILRQYCEELFITLQSYSSNDFFSPYNFQKSMQRYEKLPISDPLVGNRQRELIHGLKDPKINCVLDPGSHVLTQQDITKSMVHDCLQALKKVNNIFLSEVERLKNLRTRNLKGTVIPVSSASFSGDHKTIIFDRKFSLPVLGRAAARPESWVMETSEEVVPGVFAPYAVVFVSSNVLNPVIRREQCVFIASEDIQPHDDDLVVVVSDNGNRYLRKLWSDGEKYILQAIHPTKPVPPISILKSQAVMRKVIGVLYSPPAKPVIQSSSKTLEWYPYSSFPSKIIQSLKAILVEGDSLDPIARPGQKVLVDEPQTPQNISIEDGGLAVLEVEDGDIGNVIKRVHPGPNQWVLVSPNPVEPHKPIIVPIDKIKRVWPLRGVLFETTDD